MVAVGKAKPTTTIKPWNYTKYLNRAYINRLIFDPNYLLPTCCVLIIVELVLNVFIIETVPYTEIDWTTYMQQVESFLNGTTDYKLLKGDTGPLVYPAGFVYIYSALYYVTSHGTNIHLAQYIFLAIYLTQTVLTYRILLKTGKIPAYALIISTLTSYRIHSIYVLRLFNDPIAVLLFTISLNLFMNNNNYYSWLFGSFVYSLAVSVKMNILLYAPALLLAYLTNLTWTETVLNLTVCGLVQIVLGVPFLWTSPQSYLWGSFDFGRVFDHQWTVNYRFLPIVWFEHRAFHIFLLFCHIALLLLFLPLLRRYLTSYAKLSCVTDSIRSQIVAERTKTNKKKTKASSEMKNGLNRNEKLFLEQFENELIKSNRDNDDDNHLKLDDQMSKIIRLLILPFYVVNLIGIVCARSLHYQFYSWYFHSLLYLVYSTGYRKSVGFLLLGVIEYCWNVYPSTDISSLLLHACHIVLLWGVYRTMKL